MGICHKMMLLQSFEAQVKAAEQKKTFEDIEVEGEEHSLLLLSPKYLTKVWQCMYIIDTGSIFLSFQILLLSLLLTSAVDRQGMH